MPTRQAEYRLEEQALAWLDKNRTLRVHHGRLSEKNARLDVVAEIDGTLCFVETKYRIGRQTFEEIESKLSDALTVHDRPDDRRAQSKVLRSVWQRHRVPLFVLLAPSSKQKSIEPLLPQIAALADRWWFAWAVWLWNGDQVSEWRAARGLLDQARPKTLVIDRRLAPSSDRPRRKPPTLDDCRRRAAEAGSIEELDALLEAAKDAALRPQPTVGGAITLYRRQSPQKAIVSCFFDDTATRGVVLYVLEDASEAMTALDGEPIETSASVKPHFDWFAFRLNGRQQVKRAIMTAAEIFAGSLND